MATGNLLYLVAFSMLPGTDVSVLQTIQGAGLSVKDFFRLKPRDTVQLLSIKSSSKSAPNLDDALARAEKEIAFANQKNIRILTIADESYPALLRECPDAPAVLYAMGEPDLKCSRSLAVVGTRKATPNATEFTAETVEALGAAFPDLYINSGLAYGIDCAAHRAALKAKLPTIAVLAHGLDMIYPAQHRGLAVEIIRNGGALLTEYPSGTMPYRPHFLERNRIIAGISKGLLLVESDVRGGGMSTARCAFSYNREVMAVPGRPSDPMSSGCNRLIARNMATLVDSAEAIADAMDWDVAKLKKRTQKAASAQSVGIPQDEDALKIYEYLKTKTDKSDILDNIHTSLGLPVPTLMSLLSDMEFDGFIRRLPGNKYEIKS